MGIFQFLFNKDATPDLSFIQQEDNYLFPGLHFQITLKDWQAHSTTHIISDIDIEELPKNKIAWFAPPSTIKYITDELGIFLSIEYIDIWDAKTIDWELYYPGFSPVYETITPQNLHKTILTSPSEDSLFLVFIYLIPATKHAIFFTFNSPKNTFNWYKPIMEDTLISFKIIAN